jgi:hypothetical protein
MSVTLAWVVSDRDLDLMTSNHEAREADFSY